MVEFDLYLVKQCFKIHTLKFMKEMLTLSKEKLEFLFLK